MGDPERDYCVTRKALLAVVKSLDHFHSYLYGAKFKIRSDHVTLRWLKTLKKPEEQLARWLGKIEQDHYSIDYRPRRVHGYADSLSRRPVMQTSSTALRETVRKNCADVPLLILRWKMMIWLKNRGKMQIWSPS